MASALQAEGNGGAVDGDEFGVAAVGLEHGTDFGEGGFDFFFHGASLRGSGGKRKAVRNHGNRTAGRGITF